MSLLVGPALVAAALLALAGAQKLLDPSMTVGALRALGLPSAPPLVRLGAAVELGLAVNAVVVGAGAVWLLIAASYLLFAGFVLLALRRGAPVGTCGCFGRADTPPHPLHVGLDVVLAAVAVSAASLDRAPIDQLSDHPGEAAVVVVVSLAAVGLVYRAFVHPPGRRAGIVAGRST
jgi:hypothetical protein